MLRIAVQSKGRLYDETMMLLEEAGIKLNRGKRILLLSAKGFPVEVLFLRDDDIPQSVATVWRILVLSERTSTWRKGKRRN